MLMKHLTVATALLAGILLPPAASAAPVRKPIRNIVLVHGMLVDGSGWKAVSDILTSDGYRVTTVQEPLTGLDTDVAATRRALAQQDGPVVLVGHSYGGEVVTEAGDDPKVEALVYVAALQPDVGETMAGLNALKPALLPPSAVRSSPDGYITLEPTAFQHDVAGDLPADASAFLAASQFPTNSSVFGQKITKAAWRGKPSYGIVATQDRTISPALERWMYARSGAHVTEIEAGHLVYISQPAKVAAVIEQAASGAAK